LSLSRSANDLVEHPIQQRISRRGGIRPLKLPWISPRCRWTCKTSINGELIEEEIMETLKANQSHIRV
jgi:hypothetical protein